MWWRRHRHHYELHHHDRSDHHHAANDHDDDGDHDLDGQPRPPPPPQTIDVSIESGEVVGPTTFSFTVGDAVSIWVLSDVDAEIHVHGYDLFFEATAGVPIEIALTVDVPGIWEVELEETHVPLFVLEVTP